MFQTKIFLLFYKCHSVVLNLCLNLKVVHINYNYNQCPSVSWIDSEMVYCALYSIAYRTGEGEWWGSGPYGLLPWETKFCRYIMKGPFQRGGDAQKMPHAVWVKIGLLLSISACVDTPIALWLSGKPKTSWFLVQWKLFLPQKLVTLLLIQLPLVTWSQVMRCC